MRFLFRLDLNLYVGAGIFFWNFKFYNQTRRWLRRHYTTARRKSNAHRSSLSQRTAQNHRLVN